MHTSMGDFIVCTEMPALGADNVRSVKHLKRQKYGHHLSDILWSTGNHHNCTQYTES